MEEVKKPEKDEPPAQSQLNDRTGIEKALSDDEDMALSQMLDDFEQSQVSLGEPKPKIPKIDHQPQARPNRLALNLNRFAFVPQKRPNKENSIPIAKGSNSDENSESSSKAPENTQALDKSVRNRIMCTPSDDESSQMEPPKQPPKLPFRLNLFRKPIVSSQQSQVQQQHQENVVLATKDESMPDNDSAYDTMLSSGTPSGTLSNTFGSAAKTAKTPAIFPPSVSTQNNSEDGEDFSYLENFEF